MKPTTLPPHTKQQKQELKHTLTKALYHLSHVYLNWGRAKDLDVKEDFAKGFNLLSELNGDKEIKATNTGWRILPHTPSHE